MLSFLIPCVVGLVSLSLACPPKQLAYGNFTQFRLQILKVIFFVKIDWSTKVINNPAANFPHSSPPWSSILLYLHPYSHTYLLTCSCSVLINPFSAVEAGFYPPHGIVLVRLCCPGIFPSVQKYVVFFNLKLFHDCFICITDFKHSN